MNGRKCRPVGKGLVHYQHGSGGWVKFGKNCILWDGGWVHYQHTLSDSIAMIVVIVYASDSVILYILLLGYVRGLSTSIRVWLRSCRKEPWL